MHKNVLSLGFFLVIITSIILVGIGSDIRVNASGSNLTSNALPMTDNQATKVNIVSLSDDLNITEHTWITKNIPQTNNATLNDAVGIQNDVDFTKLISSSISNKINISDKLKTIITHYGTITIKTKFHSLVSGASYSITPNPQTGSGSLLVTDGGSGDKDGLSNGQIVISHVPKGKYIIHQVSIPTGFFSLISSTIKNVHASHLNQVATFHVVPTNVDLTKLSSTQLMAPSLNDTTLGKLASVSARIVNNVNSSIISDVDQTPQIILAGSANSTAINASINSTSSILLNTSFSPLTNGSTIVNAIGLENYSLPNSTNLVSIMPTVIANVSTTSGYVAATPPVSGVIPGQEMIIPIPDSIIPSFGGLKKLDIQSSQHAKSLGKTANWFVVEVENNIPSNIGSNGIVGTLTFFMNVQHPFEEKKTGFNWSNASNYAESPTLTIIVNKTNPNYIQKDSVGCPVVVPYTLVSGSWTTSSVSEVSSKSNSPSKCEITIQSQHLSKFAFSLKHLISLTAAQGLPGSGTVSTGTNPSSSQVAAAVIQSSTTSSTPRSTPPTTHPFTTPTVPIGVTATAKSPGSITISWTASAGATWYQVLSSLSSSDPFVKVGGTSGTSLTNAGLFSSTKYYYEVIASNTGGTSVPSLPVSATTDSVTTTPTVTKPTTPTVTKPTTPTVTKHVTPR